MRVADVSETAFRLSWASRASAQQPASVFVETGAARALDLWRKALSEAIKLAGGDRDTDSAAIDLDTILRGDAAGVELAFGTGAATTVATRSLAAGAGAGGVDDGSTSGQWVGEAFSGPPVEVRTFSRPAWDGLPLLRALYPRIESAELGGTPEQEHKLHLRFYYAGGEMGSCLVHWERRSYEGAFVEREEVNSPLARTAGVSVGRQRTGSMASQQQGVADDGQAGDDLRRQLLGAGTVRGRSSSMLSGGAGQQPAPPLPRALSQVQRSDARVLQRRSSSQSLLSLAAPLDALGASAGVDAFDDLGVEMSPRVGGASAASAAAAAGDQALPAADGRTARKPWEGRGGITESPRARSSSVAVATMPGAPRGSTPAADAASVMEASGAGDASFDSGSPSTQAPRRGRSSSVVVPSGRVRVMHRVPSFRDGATADWIRVTGATSLSYELGADDVGCLLRCEIVPMRSDGVVGVPVRITCPTSIRPARPRLDVRPRERARTHELTRRVRCRCRAESRPGARFGCRRA